MQVLICCCLLCSERSEKVIILISGRNLSVNQLGDISLRGYAVVLRCSQSVLFMHMATIKRPSSDIDPCPFELSVAVAILQPRKICPFQGQMYTCVWNIMKK